MAVTDITPPDIEPVALDYTKLFLRVDTDDDDTLILDFVRSARQRIERLISGSLITRRRRYISTRISGRGVFINHHPVRSIDTVTLTAGQGEERVISPQGLNINLRCQPPAISLKSRASWQSYLPGAQNLEIEFTAGFGTAAEDVPMPLRQAILLLTAQSYEHRGAEQVPPLPMMVDALLMPYRTLRL
jgi:uncharacterized phiE125 gp8 family phage protein